MHLDILEKIENIKLNHLDLIPAADHGIIFIKNVSHTFSAPRVFVLREQIGFKWEQDDFYCEINIHNNGALSLYTIDKEKQETFLDSTIDEFIKEKSGVLEITKKLLSI